MLGPLDWLCPIFAPRSHHLDLDVPCSLQVLMPPTWSAWFEVGKQEGTWLWVKSSWLSGLWRLQDVWGKQEREER